MSGKKVLYISHDGMTDPLGRSQVLPYLVGLSKIGFSFTIISAEKKNNYLSGSADVIKICEQAGIKWKAFTYHRIPPLISTVFDLLLIYFMAVRLYRKEKFDIVHCRSYPPSLIGLSLKKKFGCRFIFDMRGFWADERVDGKIWNLNNPVFFCIYKYFKRKEKKILINADKVISLTHRAKSELESYKINGKNKLPVTVIPCCADNNLFTSENIDKSLSDRFKRQAGIKEGDYIISYLGALGTWYMIDEMLDFYKVLKTEKQNCRFLFITAEKKEFILSKVIEKNISVDNIIIVHAKRNEVPVWLNLSDASIFFIKLVFSKVASFPTKQAEIMSMGIPLVCNSGVGDTDQIISESKGGILVENFNEESYRIAAKKLISLSGFSRETATQYARKHFSLEQGVELYRQVYSELLENKIFQ